MIGERDSAATDAAELDALRREAAQRRAELSSTVAAAASLLSPGELRACARRAARLGASTAWKAARQVVRRDLGAHGHWPGPARGAAAAALGLACAAAVALSWRLRNAGPARRPPLRAR